MTFIKALKMQSGIVIVTAGKEKFIFNDETDFEKELPELMAKGYAMYYAGSICTTYNQYKEAVQRWRETE